MTAKHTIAIEIDCGRVVCADCDWLDADKGVCEMFAVTLDDNCVRDPKCLKAEALADSLKDRKPTGETVPQAG